MYVAPNSKIPINGGGKSLQSNVPLNFMVCSPGFNPSSRIQTPSDTALPVLTIPYGLFSTPIKVNPPAGESFLYFSSS